MKSSAQDQEQRRAELVQARRAVDKLRAVHARLELELGWLKLRPERNKLAIERFEAERDETRKALRLASRKLVRSI